MLRTELIETITDTGLSENQARVYLAALSLGPSSVQKIARAADLKRTTVYPVFEALERRGLMSVHIKGFKKLYAAENPSKLKAVFEAKRQRLDNTLDELSSLFSMQTGETAIKHYQGLELIKSVYDDLLTQVRDGDYYLVVSTGTHWYDAEPHFSQFFDGFLERRKVYRLKVRHLLGDTPFAHKYKKAREAVGEGVRLFPKSIRFNVNMVIIPNSVLIHELGTPAWAMVIENRNVVNIIRQLFEISWQSYKD